MKKICTLALLLACFSAQAQGPVTRYLEDRFGVPENPVFIEKGSHAWGISGGYRNFSAVGDDSINAGYSLLSLLNVGNGQLKVWNVSPSYSTFLADDLSLGFALHYNGYAIDTDINLDLRDIINSTSEALNFTLSNRSYRHHAGGVSAALRKYMSFFGSKSIAVFGEGRLYGSYGVTSSTPRDAKDFNRDRVSQSFGVGLKAAGGVAVKLRDGSAITVSIPIFGVAYNFSKQDKTTTVVKRDDNGDVISTESVKGQAHMSSFDASRSTDLLGIQFGFVKYIK